MLKELNNAMEYIEVHLEDEFLLEKISKHINVSNYHFRKIFFALTSMTLNEYVKNRRLSEANKELLQGAQVTDIAYTHSQKRLSNWIKQRKQMRSKAWQECVLIFSGQMQFCKVQK